MLKSRVEKSKNVVKNEDFLGVWIISIIGGIVFSSASIIKLPSVINVSLACLSSAGGSIFVLGGSLISYFFSGQVAYAYPQICTILTLIAIKFLADFNNKKSEKPVTFALLSGGFYLFYSVGFAFLEGLNSYKLSAILVQAVIAGCFSYFGQNIKISSKKDNFFSTKNHLASIAILYIFILSGLTSIGFSYLNLGRIIGIFTTLVLAKKYKVIGGAIAGTLTFVGVLLSSTELASATAFLPCAALIFTFFSGSNSIGNATIFFLANFLGIIVIGITPQSLNLLLDVIFSMILFIIIPQKNIAIFIQKLSLNESKIGNENQNLSLNINLISEVLEYVDSSFSDVSKAVLSVDERKKCEKNISEAVCKFCSNSTFCWVEKFEETALAFKIIQQNIASKGYLSEIFFEENLPFCQKKDKLKNTAFTAVTNASIENAQRKKFAEMRDFLQEQFTSTKKLLNNISDQFKELGRCDEVLSIKVSKHFLELGFNSANACVKKNKYDFFEVEVFLKEEKCIDEKALKKAVSNILGCDISYPIFFKTGEILRVHFFENPEFEIENGVSQICGKDSDISGDSYEIFDDYHGNCVILISDGMGSGKRANIDSMLTTNMLSKLIKAGVESEIAIKLINSSMRIREWEETFATVDISSINLYSHTLDIVKAGGSATYIFRNSSLEKIEFPSMPIGILTKITPEKRTLKLKNNDVIITASDGLSEKCESLITEILIRYKTKSAKEITQKMSETIKIALENEKYDDITIAVSKFTFAN